MFQDDRPDLLAYGPGTTFVGVEPAGMAAAVLIVDTEAAQGVASDLLSHASDHHPAAALPAGDPKRAVFGQPGAVEGVI